MRREINAKSGKRDLKFRAWRLLQAQKTSKAEVNLLNRITEHRSE
jgi:hypothetical protein